MKFDLPSMNLKVHLKKPLWRKADKTSSSDPKCNRLLMLKDSFKRGPFAIDSSDSSVDSDDWCTCADKLLVQLSLRQEWY